MIVVSLLLSSGRPLPRLLTRAHRPGGVGAPVTLSSDFTDLSRHQEPRQAPRTATLPVALLCSTAALVVLRVLKTRQRQLAPIRIRRMKLPPARRDPHLPSE